MRWDEAEQEVRIWSASPKTWRRMARLGVAPYQETTTGGTPRGRFYRVPAERFRWGTKRKAAAGGRASAAAWGPAAAMARGGRRAARGVDAMTRERTTDTETTYADRVLHEAMLGATAGLDRDQARTVVADTLAALAKMTAALKTAEYLPGGLREDRAEHGARDEISGRPGAVGGVRVRAA